MDNPIRKYRVIFDGDKYVGKKSLIRRIIYNNFDINYLATIGIDFFSKKLNYKTKSHDFIYGIPLGNKDFDYFCWIT